jgi:Mn-containing catalase
MNAFELGMRKLLIAQLSEMYFCENQLLHALDVMAHRVHDPGLKELFISHRLETIEHAHRLEAAFAELKEEPKAFPCRGVDGLLDDGKWVMHKLKYDPALDLAVVAAAQKVEAIEAAGYRAIIRLCEQLGQEKIAELCSSNLEEELEADEKLHARATELNQEPARGR